MYIRQLNYLVAVAREKHFARAANACNVTQPTLSAGIQKLERELGLPLIERGHQFSRLTPEGERVLNWAHRIIADFDGLKKDLTNYGRGLSGTLKLGAIPAALPSVSLLTGPFCSRHPGVTVQVQSLTSTAIQRGLDTFELDAGLTYLENEPLNNIRSVPLYKDQNVFVIGTRASTFRSIQSQASISWAEAATYPLCLLTPDMQNRRIINQIFEEIGVKPEPRLEVNSYDSIASHVRHGDLCSILPHSYCHITGISEGIRTIPLMNPIRMQSIGLVTADREPLPPVAQAFIRFAGALNIDGKIKQ